MPKELTHWILADKAIERLDGDCALRRSVEEHRSLYLAGAVLPDTLMHIFRGPYDPLARNLADRFHDADANSYAPLIRAESRFPGGLPGGLLACLLGVICHIQADTVLHPFVYAVTGVDDIGRHYRLETMLDVRFLRGGIVPPAARLSQLVENGTRDTLLQALALLFDPEEELPPQAFEDALSLHCRFQGMYDRTLWKVAVRALALVAGSPFREQQHLFYPLSRAAAAVEGDGESWNCPVSGKARSASIEELAEEVVQRTAALFTRIAALGSLAAALEHPPGANLLTGSYGVRKSVMEQAISLR